MRIVSEADLGRALAGLPDNPRIVVSGNAAYPQRAMRVVDESVERYVVHALNAPHGIPDRDGVTAETCFVGAGMRHHPRISYIPCRLSLVPRLFHGRLRPDAVVIHVAPEREGKLSLGIEVNILVAAIEACRASGGTVLAVINPHMPYTYGDAQIAADLVDLAVEIDEPIPATTPPHIDEASHEIGSRVAAMVEDGATLQLGIGAVPDATLAGLRDRSELRVWSEMFSDGVYTLEQLGRLNGSQPITASFAFGSSELYSWMDQNPRVQLMRTETVNDPAQISQHPMMTSINTALEVDLFGQANASRIKERIHSGFGGQTDFIVGALHAPDGHSFMALRSWHPKANVSTIVGQLDQPVTSYQQTAIVTEQGMAELWGYDEKQQAQHIIEQAAHPDVRAHLWDEAGRFGLV